MGVSGFPSRSVSRNPCSAGPKTRSRIESMLTMLMPTFTVTTSAGASRIVRATNWSSWDCPPKPRLTSDMPACRAATAGQVRAGSSASMQ